jgi:WG containing repeat
VVPLDRHILTKTSFGFIEKHNNQVTVHGLTDELEDKPYDNITFYRNWLVLFQADKKHLYDIPSKKLIASDADSIWFDRSLVFMDKHNLRKVYLSANHAIDLPADSKINFIASRDSVQFFFNENKKKRIVFMLDKGVQLFTTEYVIEESLGADYFIVSKGVKKGVLSRNGKTIVPVEMETIILTDKNHLSLLKDKKFGLFDLRSGKYFKPVYERNLIPMNKRNLIVYKDGFYGLIDQQAKPVTAFEFSEVQAWSDSLIWVKKDFQWKLINYHSQKVLLDRVKGFTWIKNNEEEKIIRIHRENYFGIVSNKRGVVIAPTLTDIKNLGDADRPFYFTEKQVEEAGIFVVLYYNHTGKLVRKQAYEEEEYDRILCEHH